MKKQAKVKRTPKIKKRVSTTPATMTKATIKSRETIGSLQTLNKQVGTSIIRLTNIVMRANELVTSGDPVIMSPNLAPLQALTKELQSVSLERDELQSRIKRRFNLSDVEDAAESFRIGQGYLILIDRIDTQILPRADALLMKIINIKQEESSNND